MHQKCIKWHLKLICMKCFQAKEGRLTVSQQNEVKCSSPSQCSQWRVTLFSSILLQSFFFMCFFFQVIPRSQWHNPKKIVLISPNFPFFQGVPFPPQVVLPVTEDQWVKKKCWKQSAQWSTKLQNKVIQVWLMRTVWSSSEVKTCASGIWLCREEDSWPAWWRTPSTGKAKSWWTTSLGEQREGKQLSDTHLFCCTGEFNQWTNHER